MTVEKTLTETVFQAMEKAVQLTKEDKNKIKTNIPIKLLINMHEFSNLSIIQQTRTAIISTVTFITASRCSELHLQKGEDIFERIDHLIPTKGFDPVFLSGVKTVLSMWSIGDFVYDIEEDKLHSKYNPIEDISASETEEKLLHDFNTLPDKYQRWLTDYLPRTEFRWWY